MNTTWYDVRLHLKDTIDLPGHSLNPHSYFQEVDRDDEGHELRLDSVLRRKYFTKYLVYTPDPHMDSLMSHQAFISEFLVKKSDGVYKYRVSCEIDSVDRISCTTDSFKKFSFAKKDTCQPVNDDVSYNYIVYEKDTTMVFNHIKFRCRKYMDKEKQLYYFEKSTFTMLRYVYKNPRKNLFQSTNATSNNYPADLLQYPDYLTRDLLFTLDRSEVKQQ